jgi:hypothetical protein
MPLVSAGFGFDRGQAGADHLFDQGDGEGSVDGKLNGALGELVGRQVRFEFPDDSFGGKEGAMVGESSEPNENLLVFESRNPIADDLGGLAGSGSAYGGADFLECRALRLGDSGEVFVDGSGRLGWFGVVHAGMVSENDCGSPCILQTGPCDSCH